jgi:steroid delta-isomerase-like uncharacterized protein
VSAAFRAETAALLGEYFAALYIRDIDGLLDCVSEDVVLDINQGERVIGSAALRAYFFEQFYHFRESASDVRTLISESGYFASAEYAVSGTYLVTIDEWPAANNQAYQLRVGCFFEIDDERISRISPHYNLNKFKQQL